MEEGCDATQQGKGGRRTLRKWSAKQMQHPGERVHHAAAHTQPVGPSQPPHQLLVLWHMHRQVKALVPTRMPGGVLCAGHAALRGAHKQSAAVGHERAGQVGRGTRCCSNGAKGVYQGRFSFITLALAELATQGVPPQFKPHLSRPGLTPQRARSV